MELALGAVISKDHLCSEDQPSTPDTIGHRIRRGTSAAIMVVDDSPELGRRPGASQIQNWIRVPKKLRIHHVVRHRLELQR